MHQRFARYVQGSVGTTLDAAIRDHTSFRCTLGSTGMLTTSA